MPTDLLLWLATDSEFTRNFWDILSGSTGHGVLKTGRFSRMFSISQPAWTSDNLFELFDKFEIV